MVRNVITAGPDTLLLLEVVMFPGVGVREGIKGEVFPVDKSWVS